MPSSTPSWDELLERLAETPRENGTAALHETAIWLADTLRALGVEVELVPFVAHPHVLRLTGVWMLAAGLLYARWLLAGRLRAAAAVALLAPTAVLLQLELRAPVYGWLGAQREQHVLARIPAAAPEQRLILSAHYDTKTDLLDHVERAPVDWLGLPVAALLLAGVAAARSQRSRRRRGLVRGAAAAAVLYGIASFAALSAGAFLPGRSPGALDDGASCAALVRLAAELARDPPARTEVELLFLAAEEIGVQGSRLYAQERFPGPPRLPTQVVNLEGLGASPHHQIVRLEVSALGAWPPDPKLAATLGAVHRRVLGAPLERTAYPAATDARSFLRQGIPAATLTSQEPGRRFPRHLHSARDGRQRVDEASLEASLRFLRAVLREIDAGVGGAPAPPATVDP